MAAAGGEGDAVLAAPPRVFRVIRSWRLSTPPAQFNVARLMENWGSLVFAVPSIQYGAQVRFCRGRFSLRRLRIQGIRGAEG
jgi:hypothetical protein